MNDTSFQITACWYLRSEFEIGFESNLNVKLKLDSQFGRAKFKNENTNSIEFNTTASDTSKCVDFEVLVKFSIEHIFQPIDLEFGYAILNSVPLDSEGE